jgi:hypothetical protein
MSVYFSCFCFSTQAIEKLTLGVLGVASDQRYSYDWITRKFEKTHPSVKVINVAHYYWQKKTMDSFCLV